MPRIFDAELVDEPGDDGGPKSRQLPPEPREPRAPLHVELHAWPAQARARCVVREQGKAPREFAVDGSLLVMLLTYLKGR